MKTNIYNGTKIFFYYALAIGEELVRMIAESFLTAEESFAEKDTRTYKAEWGKNEEFLSSSHGGFSIGEKQLSLEDSMRHCYLQGTSGSGKGIFVIINTILNVKNSSIVVFDPSGENADLTTGYLLKQGYKIVLLNFSKPLESDAYNPLDWVKEESDINQLAALLIRTTLQSERSDPFWGLEATTLLALFIRAILMQEKKYRNLCNVRRALVAFSGDASTVDHLFVSDDKLYISYLSYVKKDNKLLSSVVSSCLAALQLFNDENICKSTSISTIDFASIRNEKTAIFIQSSTLNSVYLAPLVSVFFEQLFLKLLEHIPSKNELNIALVIDEASTLSLPSLPIILQNLRKYRGMCLSVWQSFESMVHSYGTYQAQVIKDNSFTKIFLAGQSLPVSKELSETLGRTEILDATGKTIVQPLMLHEDIRSMQQNEALVICGNRKPLKVKMQAWFESPRQKTKTRHKPVRCVNDFLKDPIPLLPLYEKD